MLQLKNNMNFFFKLFLLILLLSTSSCRLFYEPMPESWDWGMKPRPLRGVKTLPPTDTMYGKGFKDGCSTGWETVARGLLGDLQAKYDFQRSQKSPDYETGWWDGMEHCTYLIDWDIL
jgi:hypothetical protein